MRFNIMILKSLNEKCFVVRHEALLPGIVNSFSERCNICTNNEKIRAIYLSTWEEANASFAASSLQRRSYIKRCLRVRTWYHRHSPNVPNNVSYKKTGNTADAMCLCFTVPLQERTSQPSFSISWHLASLTSDAQIHFLWMGVLSEVSGQFEHGYRGSLGDVAKQGHGSGWNRRWSRCCARGANEEWVLLETNRVHRFTFTQTGPGRKK